MNVLSLFDGLSGAHLALDLANIDVDNYYAAEVDKYAIKITQKNYPSTIQLGSVTELPDELLRELDIDLLIGGSPCQGFSLAGKMKGMSTSEGIEITTLDQYLALKEQHFEFDGQSYLFWEFIRILQVIQPKYFLLENVRVQKKWKDIFDEVVGVTPILINSALLSPQNRERYYWTNIPNIEQPEHTGLLLKDILLDGEGVLLGNQGKVVLRGRMDKAACVLARDYKGFGNQGMTAVRCDWVANATDLNGHDSIKRVYSADGKSPTVNTCTGGNRQTKVLIGEEYYRRLTPLEHERLQMIPDNYTEGVSNSQRYKMVGNSFTITVIAHILKNIKNTRK